MMVKTANCRNLERSTLIMKRFLTLLFTTLLLTAALCVTAYASDYDTVAQELSAIGMFRGTANGFELDRAPTRSEAAIMLVRLYGAEEQAKTAYAAGEIKHPFTDVSEFASPYVAWLYTNGITNGFTETTFGSQRTCTVQNYVTFLLRALGYKDGTDFQYADALPFAQEKGFYEPVMFPGTFLRDDLAAVTYQALAADMADGKTYLLDSLVKSGAIDQNAAKPITDKIKTYRAMLTATKGMDENAMDVDMDVKMDMTMTAGGETTTMPTFMKGNMKLIVDGGNVKLAYTTATEAQGETVKMDMWMKDGWMYTSTTMSGEEKKVKSSVEDQMAAVKSLSGVNMSAMDVSGLAMLESVTTKKAGTNTEYTVVIGKGMNSMLESVTGAMDTGTDGMDMRFGKITATYTVDGRGILKKTHMIFDASMKMELPMEDGTVLSLDTAYAYDMTMTVNATGRSVKITFPDFSGYQEIPATSAGTTPAA